MNIALIHDHLIQNGGAEKVLERLQALWPKAPTYTLFFDPKRVPTFAGRDIRTSFLQHMPLIKSKYAWYLPLMPSATEGYDLRDFDVVVSSASGFAKGIITKQDAIHICYCHTPTRYLWSDTHAYVQELRVPRLIKAALPPVLSRLRLWDYHAANRVDHFVANSQTVRERIKKYYQRDARVIHPPVDIERFSISNNPKTYFLTGGRLVAYKRYDLVIEAANKTGLPLKIFGTGPVENDLKSMAASNVEFLGPVDDDTQAKLYADARAFIHPQEEDFGITPVESMASGRPVIAYASGGATETIIPDITGLFMQDQSWEELADIMIRFDETRFNPRRIRKHAATFSHERFANEMKQYVEAITRAHQKRSNQS